MAKNVLCGKMNISDGKIKLIQCQVDAMVETSRYLCILLGEIFSPYTFQPISCSYILSQYKILGTDVLKEIDGLFTLLLYDKENNNLVIMQDPTSSKNTIYYTQIDEFFFFSTELKSLLYYSGITRSVNQSVLPCLVRNFCVMNTETLVNGVLKIMPKTFLQVNRHGVRIFSTTPCTIASETADSGTLQAILKDYLRMFVSNQPDKAIHMALSSGYDSNLILSQVATLSDVQLHGYTIGSTYAGNEIPAVQKIAKHYNNLNLHSYEVGSDSFQDLADLEWRLESAVHENGVVLQYYLAKIASINDCAHILCGETADEIMYSAYEEESCGCNMEQFSRSRIPFFQNPFFSANLVVLKKSSIMLNSFGVTAHYPFKNKRFISFGQTIASKNQDQKTAYKDLCGELIQPKVYKALSSLGGATDPRALLNTDRVEYFSKKIQHSKFGNHFMWCNTPAQTLVKLCFEPTKQGFELASDILSGVCLLLFDELFLSGKYDSEFFHDEINAVTSDIFR